MVHTVILHRFSISYSESLSTITFYWALVYIHLSVNSHVLSEEGGTIWHSSVPNLKSTGSFVDSIHICHNSELITNKLFLLFNLHGSTV